MDEPADFWEQRYASSDRVWSGRANATLVDIVLGLTPGRALDLGCGEGGDAIWLAEQGWRVTGVDISPSAIARAGAEAAKRRLSESTRFETSDLENRMDAEQYDLVTACFLQSPVALARQQILRAAAQLVSSDGRLLIVSHAAPPPWSKHLTHHHPEGMPQPSDDLVALDLAPGEWQVELAEIRQRDAVGPDGEHAVLDDGVVLVRRLAPAPARDPLRVVAAVIVRDGAVLACRRKPGTSAAGRWEFPGGKVEPGEAPDDALRREIREELGVDIRVVGPLLRATTPVGDVAIDLACSECRLTDDEPAVSTDHDLLVWQPLDRLAELDWAAPDLPMVNLLARAS